MSTYEERQAIRDANPGVIVDENSVYNPETGQEQSIGSFQSSGGGGDGGGGYQGIDMSGIMRGFAESSGFSIKQLEEQKRQFDETMKWQVQMWQQQGLPDLAIRQRVQDLEERKFAELSGQATRQQNWVEEIGKRQAALAEKAQADANAIAQGQLGVSQGELDLAREIQRGQLGLAQSGLGLDVLKTQASLSGPSNWIQAANFSRGVAGGNAGLPGFVQQLLSGQNTSVLGGPQPGAQQSQPLSFNTMAQGYGLQPQAGGAQYAEQGYQQPARGAAQPGVINQLNAQEAAAAQPAQPDMFAGQNLTEDQRRVAMQNAAGALRAELNPQAAGSNPVPSNSDVDAAAAQLRDVFAKGGASFGPQQLEGLTPTELEMFKGGGGAVGADVPGFMAQYERSRIGQQAAAT